MKKITQAFMKVLMNMGLKENNIKGVVNLLWEDIQAMDEMVEFIKAHPKATETEIIKKALSLSKRVEIEDSQ